MRAMSTEFESVYAPLTPDPSERQVQLAMLAGIWRRKLVVLGIVAAALVLGIVTAVIMPARYIAQAYVRGELVASDTLPMQLKDGSTGSVSTGSSLNLDAVRVIETQTRLLQTSLLARRVAEQIGLEKLQPLTKRGWLPDLLNKTRAQSTGDKLDIAAGKLLTGLTVTSDPRAYLITVRYKTGDPDLSVRIANAFVAELLRSSRLQQLFQQRYYLRDQLSNQLGVFGEKHPRVAALKTELATTDDSITRQMSESQEAILSAAGENVTKATNSSSTPAPTFIIGLFLLVGLMISIAAALWLERGAWTNSAQNHAAQASWR